MVELLQEAANATQLDATARPAPADADPVMLHEAAVLVARARLAEAHAGKDRILMEEVKAVDDLLRAGNLLVERLREWYALHAPEVTRRIGDAEELARLVADHGDAAAVMQAIEATETTGTGTPLDDEDLVAVQGFAAALRGIHTSWRGLERRIETLMAEVAPNIAAVAGPTIGARLIALAGGLHRLGTMPSGTIQTLGAETALFRHIKEGGPGPKHGILFQHPLVFQANRHHRGAISRALANQIALAARADGTTGNDLTDLLRKRLDEDVERIRKKPAPVRAPPPKSGKPGGKPWNRGGKPGGTPGRGHPRKPTGKPGGKPRRQPGDRGPARPPGRGGKR